LFIAALDGMDIEATSRREWCLKEGKIEDG
jgi:hypothetical protein